MAEANDKTALVTNTAAALLRSSSSAAARGPRSVLTESRRPRTTLALLSSSGVLHSPGSSAECAGRNILNAAVAMTARA